MTLAHVLQYPHPALATVCAEVVDFADVPITVARMKAAIAAPFQAKCIGLAANQIGVCLRIIMVEQGGQWIVMVNPKITERGGQQTVRDGCMSLDFGRTFKPRVRPAFIRVHYQDELGEPRTRRAKGINAAAIAHEVDHLEGRMFFDEISDSAA